VDAFNRLRERLAHFIAPAALAPSGPQPPDPAAKVGAGQPGTSRVLIGTAGLPFIAVFVYALARNSASIWAVATMIGSGVFALGALLGFLFGIPRLLASQAEHAAGVESEQFRYLPNSNLEQVSDWLTKILIGVGLVELTSLVNAIGEFASTLKPALGNDAAAQMFAIGLILSFFISGFLAGYLFTRLRLQAVLTLADFSALKRKVVDAALDRVDEQGKVDADALTFVARQLDPDERDPPTNELEAAVAPASAGVKKQIFDQARRRRQEAWRRGDRRAMSLIGPVFKALIAGDPKEHFHRSFAQLGYVFKDSSERDPSAAEQYLSKAIEIRDRNEERGYRIYELNRALCRIALDTDSGDLPSDPAVKDRILSDLRAARSEATSRRIIEKDEKIQSWLERNNVQLDEPQEPAPPPADEKSG
jgi:hypothetical protein